MGYTIYRVMDPMGSNLSDVEGTLARIKEAIRHDFVVGLTSKFDETMVLLKAKGVLGEDISYNRHKVLPDFLDLLPRHPC